MSCRVLSIGKYLPEKIVSNNDLEKLTDTSDEWIKNNLGIISRRISSEGQATSDLAYLACLDAIKKINFDVNDIDLIVFCTSTPDRLSPSTACILQEKLKAYKAAAFDINAVCSGFVYGLSICNAYFKSNLYKKILLVASETYSKITDWSDRQSVFFGDGAAALILEKDENGYLEVDIYSDGSGKENFTVPAGGSYRPASYNTVEEKLHFFKMNGKAVYDTATTVLPIAIKNLLQKTNTSIEDIKILIPHQPSINILKKIAKDVNIPFEKVVTCMQYYGNTAAASAPLALCKAVEDKQIQQNDKILFIAVGSGWTWGAALMKWV
jgi:3-oxoacyl-[acyl-carrier-protein] synthase-3